MRRVWTDDKVTTELRCIIEILGHFPTQKELRKVKRSDLITAITRHGGVNKFRKKLCIEIINRPSDYWTDELIIAELNKIVTEKGHFPTQRELNAIGKAYLRGAIAKHGGLNIFREKLGYIKANNHVNIWNEGHIIDELEQVIAKIGHFPTKKELGEIGKKSLRGAITANGGSGKFRQIMGYVKQHRLKQSDKWTDELILSELRHIITTTNSCPKWSELHKPGRYYLTNAINTHGGYPKFQKLLGYEPKQKPAGYWTEKTIVAELNEIKAECGHFPTGNKLAEMGKGGLVAAMEKHGGIPTFRALMGEKLLKRKNGYWTKETILMELKDMMDKLGHFPTKPELVDAERWDLIRATQRHGGVIYFQELVGVSPNQKPRGYWKETQIVMELKNVTAMLGHFPTVTELRKIGRSDLDGAIIKNGGINIFRKKLGVDVIKHPVGYWSKETIMSELKSIESELGHFPTVKELISINRADLTNATRLYGGLNKFRERFGLEPIQRPIGYWSKDKLIAELNKIKSELGHFPSATELRNKGKFGTELIHAMYKSGGLLATMERMGIPVSEYETYRSKLSSYIGKRGKGTEEIVMKILEDWCNRHGKLLPLYNVKLTKGSVIEFVCDVGNKVGIDVTNTENKGVVYHKWTKKDYYKHLDELWVVVFSASFKDSDYNRWNDESPGNVMVMTIYEFLENLDYATDKATLCKIDEYCACSFYTKDKLKELRQQRMYASSEG